MGGGGGGGEKYNFLHFYLQVFFTCNERTNDFHYFKFRDFSVDLHDQTKLNVSTFMTYTHHRWNFVWRLTERLWNFKLWNSDLSSACNGSPRCLPPTIEYNLWEDFKSLAVIFTCGTSLWLRTGRLWWRRDQGCCRLCRLRRRDGSDVPVKHPTTNKQIYRKLSSEIEWMG